MMTLTKNGVWQEASKIRRPRPTTRPARISTRRVLRQTSAFDGEK
jgi:hypothetical protein